jgi:hypothetical protein
MKKTPAHSCVLALFTIAKIWDQPKCSAIDEQIKEICYVYTIEFHSAIKRIIAHHSQQNE